MTLGWAWMVGPDQAMRLADRAYPFVLRGVELNPESATAHASFGMARAARFNWIGAEQSFRRAMELRSDRKIADRYASLVMRSGRSEQSLKQYALARELEPSDRRPSLQSWHARVAKGQFTEAREKFDWLPAHLVVEDNLDIAFNASDPEKLKVAIRAIPKTDIAFTALYATVLAEFDSPERVLSVLRDVYGDRSLHWIRKHHDLAMVAAYFGDPEFALQVKSEEVRANVLRISSLWYPVMSEVRKLPEFKQLVTDLNLVEYWRAYDWADACRVVRDEDFECS